MSIGMLLLVNSTAVLVCQFIFFFLEGTMETQKLRVSYG